MAGGVIARGRVGLAAASADRRPGWAEHQPGQGPVLIPPLRRMVSVLAFASRWGSERRTSQHRTAHHEDRESEREQSGPPTQVCRPVMPYSWPWGRVPRLLLAWGIGDPQAGRLPRLGCRRVAVGVRSSLRHWAPLTGPAPPGPFHPGRPRPVLIVGLSGPGVSASHHPQVVTFGTLLVLGLMRGVSPGRAACFASRVAQATRPWSRLGVPARRPAGRTIPRRRAVASQDALSHPTVFGFCRTTDRLSLAVSQT